MFDVLLTGQQLSTLRLLLPTLLLLLPTLLLLQLPPLLLPPSPPLLLLPLLLQYSQGDAVTWGVQLPCALQLLSMGTPLSAHMKACKSRAKHMQRTKPSIQSHCKSASRVACLTRADSVTGIYAS